MRYQVRMHPTIDVLVSSVGEVFVPANGVNKAHWTFGCKNSREYLTVMVNGKTYLVHRLVAETFIPNPENKPEVDHTTRTTDWNLVDGLRWATRSQNQRNTSKHDRIDARGGTHLYEDKKQYEREREIRRRKTHKRVQFSDGSRHWVPLDDALILLDIPVKDRTYRGG